MGGTTVAAVLCFLAATAGSQALPGAERVIINEVHYHPADDIRESEFLELYNAGSEDTDLGGWVIAGGVQLQFPPRTMIERGGFLLVAADPDVLRSNQEIPDATPVVGPYDGSLSNGGERVELWTSTAYLASFIEYSDTDPWPETPDGLGPSLERTSTLREEADARAWEASIVVGGTPGEPNSVRVDDPLAPGRQQDFIPQGASWKYFRGETEPPADWTSPGFDDGSWDAGPAGFGYDDNDDATVLADMQGNYSTLYIRREFQIADPARIESLQLSILVDDGYVAYLNGVEVDRFNAPGAAGTPLAHTAVSSSRVNEAARRDVDLTGALDLLQPGANVLAVVGLNAEVDNPDFSLHPWLSGQALPGAEVDVAYVGVGDEWRFLRGAVPPPAEWNTLDFIDADWEAGASGIGYGDGDDATVLDDMRGNYLTVFLRTEFRVTDASKVSSLSLDIDYDDGFVAYLNGTEVARSNVAGEGHDVPALASHEAGSPEVFPVQGFASVLRTGVNVLAISGHNSQLSSSDASLIPALYGTVRTDELPPIPDTPPERPARTVVINEVFPNAGEGWVEIYNTSSVPVALEGMHLELYPASAGRYEFPPGAGVEAGGRALVSEADLGFSLSGVAALILSTAGDLYLDALNPRTVAPGLSTGRWPDGADNRRVFTSPTPGASNKVELETRIVINEIQFHPSDDNTGGEFVELHNRSDAESVDISGWSFTRGVAYTFPDGTVVPPGGFVVVARDPAAAAAYYGIPLPLGPYSGRLRNDAETLLVRDAIKNPADRVRYADEGSWSVETDGLGPSAELVNPALENRYGAAWAASDGSGTPGAPNSRLASDPDPVVVDVRHDPVIPDVGDSVLVTATVSDERPIVSATLFWRRDGGGSASQVPMADDGAGDDGIANNGVYGAAIPPQADSTIVLFWVRAEAAGGQSVTVPQGAPDPAFLYQVESPRAAQVRPVYRIIMQADTLSTLRNRSVNSNVLLDCTFVAGGRAHYNRGVRYRGHSARSCSPRSYRVQFDHDLPLDGFQRLNINGCHAQRQWIGLDFLSRTGIATPQAWFRKLSINGNLESGVHLRVEAVDEEFLTRVFPADDGGNLYRGVNQANLDYRGEDFGPYTGNYEKRSNEEAADWSDIVDLCRVLDSSTTSDEDYPAALEQAVDIQEWALYFAAFALLGSTEGSILLDRGDDYYLYRRPSDGRWILLPWDLDSCFDQEQQPLFRPTVDQIERFLESPRYAPLYWCHLESLRGGAFREEFIENRIDHLTPLFSAGIVSDLRSYAAARRLYVDQRLHSALTVNVNAAGRICGDTIVVFDTDLFLQGVAPGCGTTEVLVNGTPGSYNPLNNEWSATIQVDKPSQLTIRCVDRNGGLVTRRDLDAVIPAQQSSLSGTVSASRTLTREDSPYRVTGAVLVTAGTTLDIEAGATLIFDTDARLVIEGKLLVDGTAAEPVLLATDACGGTGEGILVRAGSSGNRISHARLTGLLGVPGYTAGLVADGASIVVDHAVFSAAGEGTAVQVAGTGDVTIEDSRFENLTTGVLVQGASATVRRCELQELGGAALHFMQGAGGTVEHSLLRDDTVAVAVTSGSNVNLEHLTIFGAGTGIDVEEATPGDGGGVVTADSLIIWQAGQSVADTSGSASITFSDLAAVRVGEGNISADPLFNAPETGDFRLVYFSPCRATGGNGEDMGAFPYESLGETGSFLRCDSNVDGDNDLSDAVFTLIHLFEGGQDLPCPPAADCDASGQTDITDVIFDLNYLFLAGPTPPPPFPQCEVVPVSTCPGDFCAEP